MAKSLHREIVVSPFSLKSSAAVATGVHAALILGITFLAFGKTPVAPTIEVTLAKFTSATKQQDADFIAQANQEGSGTEQEVKDITTDRLSPFQNESESSTPPTPPKVEVKPTNEIVTSINSSVSLPPDPDLVAEQETPPAEDLGSLLARLSVQQQSYASLPKVRRISAVSTMAADEAEYLRSWQERIEDIGNKNYPAEAVQRNLYGDLQLRVSVLPDGKVEAVEIINSSGIALLDQAAVKIVRLSSPFPPFEGPLRGWDRIEIIRTWRFLPSHELITKD